MVDIETIKQLIQMMVDHDLVEIALRDGSEEVNLKRPGTDTAPSLAIPMHAPQPQVQIAPAVSSEPVGQVDAPQTPPAKVEEDLIAIRSPMVGTFYASPSPETPPFVSTNSTVSPDSIVCILEAMKVFNEIKAEVSGTIVKLLVKDQDPIEYGQELFLVRPPG